MSKTLLRVYFSDSFFTFSVQGVGKMDCFEFFSAFITYEFFGSNRIFQMLQITNTKF